MKLLLLLAGLAFVAFGPWIVGALLICTAVVVEAIQRTRPQTAQDKKREGARYAALYLVTFVICAALGLLYLLNS